MSFFNVRLYDLLTILTFAALLGAVCIDKRMRIKRTSLGVPFALYCFAIILSFFNSPYLSDSIRQLCKLLGANVALYIVITSTVTSRRKVEQVIKIILVGGIFVCLVGTIQNIAFHFFGANWFFIKSNYRATATFAESGWYPQYISLLFTIALPLYLSRAFKHWKRWLGAGICIFLLVIASEMSRAAYVITFFVILAGLLLRIGGVSRIKLFAKITTFGMLALVLASLLHSFLFGHLQFVRLREPARMFALDEPSNAIRVQLSSHTWKRIVDHPIIGQGFGTWGRVVRPEIGQIGKQRGGGAFNVILGVLYDAGVLGLIAFGMICFSYLNACFRLLKSTSDAKKVALLQVAILIFVNLFVAAQLHPSWLIGYTWFGVAVGMAIVNVIKKSIADENSFSTS